MFYWVTGYLGAIIIFPKHKLQHYIFKWNGHFNGTDKEKYVHCLMMFYSA